MADNNWFRRKTWTENDRQEFLSRLRRSRSPFNKAQYARIQAYELLTTRTNEAYFAALELLDMILKEWPETHELASVHHHRAECLLGLGDLHGAINAYRKVFEAQRFEKNYITRANLDFGWLVATSPIQELYNEALEILSEFPADTFPIDRYKTNAIRALIFAARGNAAEASTYATRALEAATATHSGFRYHADLGLVTSPDERVQDRLREIAL